jgi:hypothetical protein
VQISRASKAIAGAVVGALIPLLDRFLGITVPVDAVPVELIDQAAMSAVGAVVGYAITWLAPKNKDENA